MPMRIPAAAIGLAIALNVALALADEEPTATTRITSTAAYQQYQMIQDWLRENGLLARAYEEIVARAGTSEPAAKYVQCHEDTKSPIGETSRLELLSFCLTGLVTIGPQAPPESLAAATP